MVRVIHTADTHIGYRQYHSDDRRRDFLTAFESIVDDAIEEQVDAVVHAGDLFHDKRPELADIQGTIAALTRLRDAEIPFLGIVGNHERKRDAQWLDLFEDLALATRLGQTPTMIGDVALYGLDYVSPAQRDRLDVTFEPAPAASSTAVVGHGLIEQVAHGDWDVEHFLETAPISFDAVLLGDYHEHMTEFVNDTVVTYPGSTERVSADERPPRGYNLVTFEPETVDIRQRAIDGTRSFVYVDVEVTNDRGREVVLDRLDEYDLEEAVVIVTLSGEGTTIAPAAIEAYATDAGALIARVGDKRNTDGTTEAELSVQFADPDRAVRQALAEESFSAAAMTVDELIRDLDISTSNVRDRTRDRISSLLADDPGALTRQTDCDDDKPNEEETPSATPAANEPEESQTPPSEQQTQASMEEYL